MQAREKVELIVVVDDKLVGVEGLDNFELDWNWFHGFDCNLGFDNLGYFEDNGFDEFARVETRVALFGYFEYENLGFNCSLRQLR